MEEKLIQILRQAIDRHASDVFIVVGRPVSFRIHGNIESGSGDRLNPDQASALIREIYRMAENRDFNKLINGKDDDFSLTISGLSRFRVCAYMQRGSYSAVMRVIPFELPDPEKYNIPPEIIRLGDYPKGMVLVTGTAGSGKSTTLACIIDDINEHRETHIITLEDPIEYLHRHKKSIVSQREIIVDTESYVTALRAALRQSPDVILLGEMRDFDTISVALTAAETGHLLLSTLHTMGASNTINRILDVFPANQQSQVAAQLSDVLQAVVSQQLVPTTDGNVIPVFEIMTVTDAIKNMIRSNKVYQIDGMIFSSKGAAGNGMLSMDAELNRLVDEGRISAATARQYAINQDRIRDKI